MYKEIKGPRYFMRKAQNTMKQVIIKFYNSVLRGDKIVPLVPYFTASCWIYSLNIECTPLLNSGLFWIVSTPIQKQAESTAC